MMGRLNHDREQLFYSFRRRDRPHRCGKKAPTLAAANMARVPHKAPVARMDPSRLFTRSGATSVWRCRSRCRCARVRRAARGP
jgi:hypothetical protein